MAKKILVTILFAGLLATSAILFYIVVLLKDYIKHTDISTYPLKHINKQYHKEKIWLISYAGGDDVYAQNQNNLKLSSSMTQAFDVVISYQPHHIDPKFYEKHKETLSKKRGNGYYLWKPYVVLDALKMMPENDVLLFVDCTTIFEDEIYETLELVKQHDITLFPNFHTNRQYMKKIMIDKMLNGDESFRDKIQLESGFLLLRNNAKTRKFIEDWLYYCEDPDLLTDSKMPDEYSDFLDNRHDQSVLTALYYKNPTAYNLYHKPFPARMKSFIVTRRRTSDISLSSITYHKELGDFDWTHANKYLLKLKDWLIGPQRSKVE